MTWWSSHTLLPDQRVCVCVRVHPRAHSYVCTCELALGCAGGRVRMRVSVNHGHDIRLNNRGTHSYPSGVAKTTARPITILFGALAWWNRQSPSCKRYCKPYTYVHLQSKQFHKLHTKMKNLNMKLQSYIILIEITRYILNNNIILRMNLIILVAILLKHI